MYMYPESSFIPIFLLLCSIIYLKYLKDKCRIYLYKNIAELG